MGIFFHIAAFEYEGDVILQDVVLDAVHGFLTVLAVQVFPEDVGEGTSGGGFAANEQVIGFGISADDAQEAVLLDIGFYRKMEFVAQAGELGFGAFIDGEELIIASGYYFVSFVVNEQTSGLGGDAVPCFVVECLSCEIERGDSAVPVFLYVPAAPHFVYHLVRSHIYVLTRESGVILGFLFFLGLEDFVLNGNGGDTLLCDLYGSQVSAPFHISFQIVCTLCSLDGGFFDVAVTVDLDGISVCVFAERFVRKVCFAVAACSTDQLVGGNGGKLNGHVSQSAVGDEEGFTIVGEVDTLAQAAIEFPDGFFGDAGFVQLGFGDELEFPAVGDFVIGVLPEPSFMISFQKDHVFVSCLGQKEVYGFGIFDTPVYVVAGEDVQFVRMEPAVLCEILLQGGVAAVDITDDMDLLPVGQDGRSVPDLVQFVRLQNLDACGDFLGFEAREHFIDDFFRHLLQEGSGAVALQQGFSRGVGHVDAVNPVAVLVGKVFVAFHLFRLGIGSVDDGELTMLHSGFENLEQGFPYQVVVFRTDTAETAYVHGGTGAHKADVIGAEGVGFQAVIFDIGRFSAAGCAAEQEKDSHFLVSPFSWVLDLRFCHFSLR